MVEHFPIFKGAIYNTNVANNTDFFGADLLPTDTPTTFLIYFVGTTAGGQTAVLPWLKRTNGGTTVIEKISGQTTNAYTAQYTDITPYMFQVLVAPGDSINFKTPTGLGIGNIGIVTLIVVEVETATVPYMRVF